MHEEKPKSNLFQTAECDDDDNDDDDDDDDLRNVLAMASSCDLKKTVMHMLMGTHTARIIKRDASHVSPLWNKK